MANPSLRTEKDPCINCTILWKHFENLFMDCLKGQRKVARHFKQLKLEQENIKDTSLSLRKSLKAC